MTNLTQTLMVAAIAMALMAIVQVSAGAMPTTTGTRSLTTDHPSFVMASDRGWYDRERWRGDRRDDRWYRGDSDRDDRWRYRDRDWDRRHHHLDTDDALLFGGALLGLYLLTR